MVVLKKSLLDTMSTTSYAYALMLARDNSLLFSLASQVVGYFTKHDMVLLVASGTSLKTANIFEVMHTSAMTLNVSIFLMQYQCYHGCASSSSIYCQL